MEVEATYFKMGTLIIRLYLTVLACYEVAAEAMKRRGVGCYLVVATVYESVITPTYGVPRFRANDGLPDILAHRTGAARPYHGP